VTTDKPQALDPIQYLRGGRWIEVVVPLIKTNPRVKEELIEIGGNYLDAMESVLEDDLSPEDLAEDLNLRAHEFRVRCKEFHWLRDHIGPYELAKLGLVLAEEIFPDKTWDILEGHDEFVVADDERSMVFDISHCHELSALGVLALCEDPEALKNPKAVEEVIRYRDEKNAALQASLEKARKFLDRFSQEGTVLDFPKT
jgi:hypothetical protein